MASLPKNINNLINHFSALPGIGPKSASRIVFSLLHKDNDFLAEFSDEIQKLKESTKYCTICHNLTTEDLCEVCSDKTRNKSQIMVVEDVLDLIAFERTDNYNGCFHVLHGLISPLRGVGPKEIRLESLIKRLEKDSDSLELVIATSPSLDGEATAMYIKQSLVKLDNINITRIARGVPTGADLDYTDKLTLTRSLEGRSSY